MPLFLFLRNEDDVVYRVNVDHILYYFQRDDGMTSIAFNTHDDAPLLVKHAAQEIDRLIAPTRTP